MKISVLSVVLFFSLIQCYTAAESGSGLIGGPEEVSVDDPHIVELSQLALNFLNERMYGLRTLCVTMIMNASKQVINGTLTHLGVLLGQGTMRNRCEVDVWEEPQTGKAEVVNFKCVPNESENENETHNLSSEPNNLEEPTSRGMFTNDGRSTNRRMTGKLISSNDNQRQRGSEESDLTVQLFNNFTSLHNKEYSSEEEKKERFNIFTSNLNKIRDLQNSERGTAQYGVTKFADLSSSEYGNLLGSLKTLNESAFQAALIPNVKLPQGFDWRKHRAVSPVKDQGKCKASWYFSVVGNIEGQWALKTKNLVSLSEQELLDCIPGIDVCEDGTILVSYLTIQYLGGLESEKDYPYHGKPEECQFKLNKAVANISRITKINSNEVTMAQWLVINGPISVALNADPFQHYAGGVAHPSEKECDPNNLNHAGLIVGFGVDYVGTKKKKIPYWIVKNSWGTKWGEKGYLRLYRGDGTCGINRFPTSAVV